MSNIDDFTKNVTDKVSETAKAVAKKSGELIEVTKLNLSIYGEESKIEKLYCDIGKIVYEGFKKGEDVDVINKELCESIDELVASKDAMKLKILELKNQAVCPKCGNTVDDSDENEFCPKCGEKV